MRDINTNRVGLEVVAIGISAVTLLATVGGWLWYGGRQSQRIDSLESVSAQIQSEINSSRDLNSHQDSDIAVIKSQYAEIITRLSRIDAKLDRR